MNGWLLVFLIFVATHRLTRLAIKDEVPVVKVPRDALIKFLDPTPEQRAADPAARGHWNGRPKNLTLFWIGGVALFWGVVYAGIAAANGNVGRAAAVAVVTAVVALTLGVIGSGDIGSTLAYLLECPWCMSAYAGAAVVATTDLFLSVPAPFLVWIAASSVTGLVANVEVRHDQAYALAEIEKRRAEAAEQRETRR